MKIENYEIRPRYPSRTLDKMRKMSDFVMEMPATFKILAKKRSSATVQKYLEELLRIDLIIKEENLYRLNEKELEGIIGFFGLEVPRRERIFLRLYFDLPMKFKKTSRSKGSKSEKIIEKAFKDVLLEGAKDNAKVFWLPR